MRTMCAPARSHRGVTSRPASRGADALRQDTTRVMPVEAI
jgi:hypothetical protein